MTRLAGLRAHWAVVCLMVSLTLVVGGGALVFVPKGAHANAPITVSTCDESSLDSAISTANGAAGADTILFSCDGDITLTSTLLITDDLTLDGTGHDVTLDGVDTVRVLEIGSGVLNFKLNHLTVADGLAVGSDGAAGASGTPGAAGDPGGLGTGGGLYSVGSGITITLQDCEFTSNTARGGNGGAGGDGVDGGAGAAGGDGGSGGEALGGAIFVAGASSTLKITDCSFNDNVAQAGNGGNGGKGANGSTANGADGMGGAGGSSTVAAGGAIYASSTTIQISATPTGGMFFIGNSAVGGAGGAGGDGFSVNGGAGGVGGYGGEGQGGAVAGVGFNAGPLSLSNSTFAQNTAVGGVGGAGGHGGANSVTVSGFAGGAGQQGGSGVGGALYYLANSAQLTGNSFKSNTAQGATGGAGGAGGVQEQGGNGGDGGAGGQAVAGAIIDDDFADTMTLTNNTLTGNSVIGGDGGAGGAGADGANGGNGGNGGDGNTGLGGAILGFNVALQFTTVAQNQVASGGAASGGAAGTGGGGNGAAGATGSSFASLGSNLFNLGTTTLQNTIVSQGSGANDCDGSGFTDLDYNLDSGTSCGFSAAHSLNSTNPLLNAFAANGGPTATMSLQSGSPALNVIPSGTNGCGTTVTTDQRGVTRPSGGKCEMGAWEQATTTTTLTATPNPALVGQTVTLCATVTSASSSVLGTPTGTLTFKEGATTLGTATLSGGQGCITINTLSLGNHSIFAVYGGSSHYTGSTSNTVVEVIGTPGEDVAGNPSGSNGGNPPANPPAGQQQGTSGQVAQTGSSGQSHAAGTTPVTTSSSQGFPWLSTGLGLVLLILGLAGLGGLLFYAARHSFAGGRRS